MRELFNLAGSLLIPAFARNFVEKACLGPDTLGCPVADNRSRRFIPAFHSDKMTHAMAARNSGVKPRGYYIGAM